MAAHLEIQGVHHDDSAQSKLHAGTQAHQQLTTIATNAQTKPPCYIATAVYGNDHPTTNALRQWRNNRLMPYWYGRFFVKIYYRCSPYLVVLMQRHPAMVSTAKRTLDALIKLMRLDLYNE